MTSSYRFVFSAIGTRWEIVTDEPLDHLVRAAVLKRCEEYDRTYSRFRGDSLVTAMAVAPAGGAFAFPPDSLPLFDLYDSLYTATDGAVDPLVGRNLELLGYDARYSLRAAADEDRDAHRVDRPRWEVDVERDDHVLLTRGPVVVDVGAAGKGHLVDLITTLLYRAGVYRCTVDASGDLRQVGSTSLRVGLEHPAHPGQVIGVVGIRNQALCASAVNRRTWGNGLHHVVDPRTGVPTREVIATWTIADTALLADGLATALFFTAGGSLHQLFTFNWVRMLANHTVQSSPGLRANLFIGSDNPRTPA